MTLGLLFSQGRHVRRHPRVTIVILSVLTLIAALIWALNASGASASVSYGNAALNWAEANAYGHWYAWGGTGPSYDCSGLVMEAFLHADGISLPHYTVAMVDSGKLERVSYPQRGDLAFWGPVNDPYHVEFVTIWHDTTFGAHDSGSTIGWLNWGSQWGQATFWRVVG